MHAAWRDRCADTTDTAVYTLSVRNSTLNSASALALLYAKETQAKDFGNDFSIEPLQQALSESGQLHVEWLLLASSPGEEHFRSRQRTQCWTQMVTAPQAIFGQWTAWAYNGKSWGWEMDMGGTSFWNSQRSSPIDRSFCQSLDYNWNPQPGAVSESLAVASVAAQPRCHSTWATFELKVSPHFD